MEPVQHVQVISLQGSLHVFQCKRRSPKGSEITFWKMRFSRDSGGSFNKDGQVNPMYKHATRDVDVVFCTSAVAINARQKVPCVLLRLRKKAAQGFKYMLYSLDGSSSAKLHVELTLPYEMDANISILHGPTLIWSHNDSVFYTSSQLGGVRQIPISLRVTFIGEMPLRPRGIGILGSQIHSREDLAVQDRKNETLLYLTEDGRTFNGTCLLHDAYSSVVQCMVVLSAEEVDGSLKSSVLAATCRKQLVRFENGLPEDVCILPYEKPQSIHIVHTGASGCLIAVVFDHGNVCTVWKETFKVATCWTEVRCLLVDDFVGCGTEQMLLLFKEQDSAEELFENFLLTDLCGIHYSGRRAASEALSQSDPAQENVLLTVQALDSRLQSGLAYLQELQRDLSVKDRVLQQCVTSLADLVSGRGHIPSPPQQEGLVSLWDEESEEEEHVLVERMEIEPGERLVEVQKLWHRVVGENLVFGVLLTSAIDIEEKKKNLTCSVLCELQGGAAPAVVQSWSKTLWYPEPVSTSTLNPPAAKRSRASGGPKARLALLTVTDLTSLMTYSVVTCSVLLHSPSSEAGRAVHQCGRFKLDLKEVLHGKLYPHLLKDCSADSDEAKEDLLSMLAAFESWIFRIESSEQTVVDVAGWLVGSLRAERVAVDAQYLLSHSTQTSPAMLFRWLLCSPFQGLLEVYAGGHFNMLQFLHSLCDFLPASHDIRLLKSAAPEGDSQGLSLFLEKEIQTIKEGMSSLLQEGEEERARETEGGVRWNPTCLESLQSCRDEWQSERERSSRRMRPLVDTSLYRKLVEAQIQTQLDGDLAALVIAQTGGPQ